MEQKIVLNFIPFKPQDFAFKVFRKVKISGEKKEDFHQDVFFYTLPKSDNNIDERTGYWICFEPIEGFEEFICNSFYNRCLTEQFLYLKIIEKIKENFQENEFIVPQKKIKKKIIYLVLREYKKGKQCLTLRPYYYSYEKKFGLIVDFAFKKAEGEPFDIEVQRLSLSLDKNYRSNVNFYIDKYEKINLFKEKFYSKIFPLIIEDQKLYLTNEFQEAKFFNLKTKVYIFNQNKESKSQYKGIVEYGPYTPPDKELELCFFSEEEYKIFANDLAEALAGRSFRTFEGFQKCFRIKDIKFKWAKINIKNKRETLKIIKENLKNPYSFPIVITHKKQEEYYFIKYYLLKENKSVQFVSIELLRNKEILKWAVASIAVQIFSKLGKIPWLVKPSTQKTLIIGIGQAHQRIKENEHYKIKKYFSYSVLTDSSGMYKELKILGKSENEENYYEQLRRSFKEIIEKYSQDFNNFVLHVPFKVRQDELDKITKMLTETNISKNFIVIRINDKTDFFGFNILHNSLVPLESTCVQLSSKEFIIWFEGLQYHSPVIHKRIAGPVYVEFYYSNKKLTCDDKKKYLQDVLNLSGTNWRGFNAKKIPISIFYPKLVANFVKHFDNIEKLEEEKINIENIKPWFL